MFILFILRIGIFVSCCIHTICYGFHMMFGPEGRKDVMKVLYERYPQDALDNLLRIYDFSCQAAEYCANRFVLLCNN